MIFVILILCYAIPAFLNWNAIRFLYSKRSIDAGVVELILILCPVLNWIALIPLIVVLLDEWKR